MLKIQSEIHRVDAGILAAVRQQVLNLSYSFTKSIVFRGFAKLNVMRIYQTFQLGDIAVCLWES